MAAVRISEILKRFKTISDLHPNLNAFGAGPLYDINQDIKYFPYLFVLSDEIHTIIYSEDNGYRAVEYTFTLRVGDKVNDQPGYLAQMGIGSTNGLDISSDTFNILLDIINTVSEDSLGLFADCSLIDDISVEPFFNEDSSNVNGHQATITLRVKNDKVCINPLTA